MTVDPSRAREALQRMRKMARFAPPDAIGPTAAKDFDVVADYLAHLEAEVQRLTEELRVESALRLEDLEDQFRALDRAESAEQQVAAGDERLSRIVEALGVAPFGGAFSPDEVLPAIQELRRELAPLVSVVAARRQDAERLDWLGAGNGRGVMKASWSEHPLFNRGGGEGWCSRSDVRTIREAIDAARASEREEKANG